MEITPVELLLRVARATVGASESPPNTNAGPYVERVLRGTGHGKGAPWCAAWVTDVGVHALGDQWPVRKTASVQQMADWARDQRCRYVATKTPAVVGDLFALWFPSLKRFAHVGIVTGVRPDGKVETIEGNSNNDGSREGWAVVEKTRTLKSVDRLIRWVETMP